MKDTKNLFYNQEIKEEYLNSIEIEEARNFTIYPLRKAKIIEKAMGKDMFDMTLDEIGEVLGELACATPDAVYNNTLAIEKYIDWAHVAGYRRTNINPLTVIDKVDWSKGFVATYLNYHFTREKIIDMMEQLVNEVDQALLLALFEGIKGVGFSELLNMEEKDIEEMNGIFTVHLKDRNGTKRSAEISERLALTLINAANRPSYISKNGASAIGKRWEKSAFEDSPRIFKKMRRGKQGGELDGFFVNRKFTEFKKIFGYKHLKARHVFQSGVMDMANQLQTEEKLTSKDIRKISLKYSINNVTTVKKIIEVAEFEELYGYKMKF